MAIALVLIVPGLLAQPERELASMRALTMLGRHASARMERNGMVAAIFDAIGMSVGTPAAPLALTGAGGDAGDDYVLLAEPVHLAADRERGIIAQPIDDLSAADADGLVQTLDAHFRGDDLRFEVARPNAWFVRRREPARITTSPPDASRDAQRLANLPTGADSALWRRWQNEIEMLLFDHPVNVAREARGEQAVTAIWFWGGGRLADVGPLPRLTVAASETVPGDVVRGVALHQEKGMARATTPTDDANRNLVDVVNQAQHYDRAAAVVTSDKDRDIDARWFAPTLELLVARKLESVTIIANGDGRTVAWKAKPPTLWQRLTQRRASTLRIPTASDR
jgi:hypothetical protein